MSTPTKLTLAFIASLSVASQASSAAEVRTRLADCDDGSCLIVTGNRDHPSSSVSINGHAVAVEGLRKWRAVLPVETLREWSEPYARTITVSIADARARTQASAEAHLPIGLLGRVENISMLVVRVK